MKLIGKVWQNKGNNQKLVTIPKNCDILPGDEVFIQKVEKPIKNHVKKGSGTCVPLPDPHRRTNP